MNFKKIFICIVLLWGYLMSISQITNFPEESVNDTATVNKLIQLSKTHFTDSPALAIDLATRAKLMAEKLSYTKGAAYALKNIGITYYYQAKHDSARLGEADRARDKILGIQRELRKSMSFAYKIK